jgi:hypothetical protein
MSEKSSAPDTTPVQLEPNLLYCFTGSNDRYAALGGVMTRSAQRNCFLILAAVALVLCPSWLRCQDEPPVTNVTVVVKDAETGNPISQARITLTFRQPIKYRPDKTLDYNAKTNPQGRYKFSHVTKGPIRLLVTAENHQSYGKQLEVDQDDQVIEVKLRKPQPLR